jgi:hypothetical protein
MQVQDGRRRILEPVDQRADPIVELGFAKLARAVPRRRVGVGERHHLVWPDPHDPVVAVGRPPCRAKEIVDRPRIIVPRHDEQVGIERFQALVGELDPSAQLFEHDLLEEALAGRRVVVVQLDLIP